MSIYVLPNFHDICFLHCVGEAFLLTNILSPVGSHSNRDVSLQTEEALCFSLALRQLQEVTQAKTQFEHMLALKLEGLAKNYEDKQFRMVQRQEDQKTRMAEQMDTTFREVLSQMSQADVVRPLPWFLSAAASLVLVPHAQ